MKKVLAIIIILIFVLFLNAKYLGNKGIVVKETSIYLDKLPSNMNGLKIIHFSDLLINDDTNYENLKIVFDKINALNADIIIFTGDLGNIKKIDIKNDLQNLNVNLYKYAIKGDNDNEDNINLLKECGFIYLDNSYEYLYYKDNTPLMIFGGDDLQNIQVTDENVDNLLKLALIHKPDDFDNIKTKYDLVFAGHSLGGQIRLPFWGALLKKEGAKKYTNDFYESDTSKLYINFGIGTEQTDMRLFNKPSLNVYRLYTK